MPPPPFPPLQLEVSDPLLSSIFSTYWRAMGNGVWPRKALSKVNANSQLITLGSPNPVVDHYGLIEHVIFRFFHAQQPSSVKVIFSYEYVHSAGFEQVHRRREIGPPGALHYHGMASDVYESVAEYAARLT